MDGNADIKHGDVDEGGIEGVFSMGHSFGII